MQACTFQLTVGNGWIETWAFVNVYNIFRINTLTQEIHHANNENGCRAGESLTIIPVQMEHVLRTNTLIRGIIRTISNAQQYI